jgi:hypothetical protein
MTRPFSLAFKQKMVDGKLDLVAAVSNMSLTQNDLYVFLNTGSSSAPFNDSETLQPDGNLGGGCISIGVADLNGDGFPDLLFGCTPPLPEATPAPASPAVGAIYLNNGTASPFAGVAPVDIPATPQSSFARGVEAGVLVKDHAPNVLIVDAGVISGGQSGAAYVPTNFDQNPIAQNDTAVVAINKSIQINVLANDTAAPGDTLDVTSVAITTAPGHGTATVDSTTGAINYQPASDYSGADSFQYTVRDSFGAPSNAASVSVTVQPAPVATNDTATVEANSSVMIAILTNDTSSGGTLDSASIKIVVAPTHGTASVSGGQVTYTPATGYTGLDTFQYTVQDNLGTTSNVATVSVNVTAPPSKGGGGSLSLLGILALAGLALWGRVFRSERRANPAILAMRD